MGKERRRRSSSSRWGDGEEEGKGELVHLWCWDKMLTGGVTCSVSQSAAVTLPSLSPSLPFSLSSPHILSLSLPAQSLPCFSLSLIHHTQSNTIFHFSHSAVVTLFSRPFKGTSLPPFLLPTLCTLTFLQPDIVVQYTLSKHPLKKSMVTIIHISFTPPCDYSLEDYRF